MNKENREKPYFAKRIAAYLIDFIIVALLSGAISLTFNNSSKVQSYNEQLITLTRQMTQNEITKEEYTQQSDELTYLIARESVGMNIANCSVALVYYVVLCYFCHGVTLGKYLMKLQIVSANGKELNMGHFLLRALLINLILSNILSVVFVSSFEKTTFLNVYPKISSVLTYFLIASMIFVLYREDGRGLHDLVSNTKIISTKEEKNNKEEEVVEAKVIEEKKDIKKTTKKKNTKKDSDKK